MKTSFRLALVAASFAAAGAAFAQIAPPATPVAPMTPSATVPYQGDAGGSMTLAQFQARQAQRVMAADADGDGRVSLAEYTAAMSGRRGGRGGGGGYDPAQAFARMDTNHDGYLDRAEIDAASAQRFARMDTNGDGVVTPDERMASRGGGMGGRHHGYGQQGGNPTDGQAPGTPQPQPQP